MDTPFRYVNMNVTLRQCFNVNCSRSLHHSPTGVYPYNHTPFWTCQTHTQECISDVLLYPFIASSNNRDVTKAVHQEGSRKSIEKVLLN